MIKKYCQDDLKTFTRSADGYLHLPSGDWSAVKFLTPETDNRKIHFSAESRIGGHQWLGDDCILDDNCVVLPQTGFGERTILGNECIIQRYCAFGDDTRIGREFTIEDHCRLGKRCSLEGGLIQNAVYFMVSCVGYFNRNVWGFCNTETGELYFKAVDWTGTAEDFLAMVQEDPSFIGDRDEYTAIVDYARARYKKYRRQ